MPFWPVLSLFLCVFVCRFQIPDLFFALLHGLPRPRFVHFFNNLPSCRSFAAFNQVNAVLLDTHKDKDLQDIFCGRLVVGTVKSYCSRVGV